jgi:hypothetical protein
VICQHATEEFLAVDSTLDDLRYNLSNCGLEPRNFSAEELLKTSLLESSDDVSDIRTAACRSTVKEVDPESKKSPSPVKSFVESTVADSRRVSAREVLVNLVVQEGCEKVAVVLSMDADVVERTAGPVTVEQQCMIEKERMPVEKLPEDLSKVRLEVQVQQDGFVRVAMHA